MPNISVVKSNLITVEPINIKKCTPFTCMGWVLDTYIPDEYSLWPLAVSDRTGLVDSDQAIKFEISRYRDYDYRLEFSNSQSKPLEQYTGVSLDDKKWHLLTYVCVGNGVMHYYVDGIECPTEDGIGDEGMLKSIAWSRYNRLGGGNVWVPYLYRNWQTITLYRWRYSTGLILHQQWINEIKELEQPPDPILEI